MLGHRKRLREKYLNLGYKGLYNYEVLELILTSIIKLRDCKGIAKDLLKEFKSIGGVIRADIKDIEKIKGVGPETSLYLKVIGDIIVGESYRETRTLDLKSLKGKSELINYLKEDIGVLKSEEFKVIFLNSNNMIVSDEILFKGTIDRSVVYPRKIVERGIYTKAKGVIFVHNHPSGNLQPSKKDIELTLEMQDLLDKVDIRLLDHIIVSEDSHFSFYENELIKYY